MKTISDLSINQLNSLARIAMLRLDRRVVFMADSPKPVFKEALKDTLTAYEMRTLLKLLPDLNLGRAPAITDADEPGMMLVKATWLGINTFGLHRFFSGSTPEGFGKYKNLYIADSVLQVSPNRAYSLRELEDKLAVDFYVSLLEKLYAVESRSMLQTSDDPIKQASHFIGDYWNNVAAVRHLGKDPVRWAKHVEKHNGLN